MHHPMIVQKSQEAKKPGHAVFSTGNIALLKQWLDEATKEVHRRKELVRR
jgi:hypothetical protein